MCFSPFLTAVIATGASVSTTGASVGGAICGCGVFFFLSIAVHAQQFVSVVVLRREARMYVEAFCCFIKLKNRAS